MLTLPPSVRIYLASAPVDLRMGHDGLYAIVRNQWRMDPFLCGGPGYASASTRGPSGRDAQWLQGAVARHIFRALSRSLRTASVGLYRVARGAVTPERASVLRIISTSASAYRWVVATWA